MTRSMARRGDRHLPGKPAAPQATLHARIHADLRRQIVSGAWPTGTRIPFEVDLAAEYGCSRMTVNKVMAELARAGLIERRRKAGSFVARPGGEAALLEIRDLRDEVEALRLGAASTYRHRVIARQRRSSTATDMTALGLARPTQLVAIECVHSAGERVFCHEQRIISLATVPEARDERFDALAPGPWLVARIPWTEAEHRIRAVSATKPIAGALGIEPGSACLIVARRTWGDRGPITAVRLTYPGELQELTARFRPA